MSERSSGDANLAAAKSPGDSDGLSAVIDIGSNSVLLLIGRREPGGRLDIRLDRSTVTRLSEGAGAAKVLRPAAVERTLACLREYVEQARGQVKSLRAVATEGVRMVANPELFLAPAAEILGQPVELIRGEEEARLSYLSVAMEEPDDRALRVIDIGGGSTELVCGHGQKLEQACSHPIGSVRLTEALVHHDPPTPEEIEAIEATAHRHLATQPVVPAPELHGLAGTVTTAAALMLGLSCYERERVDGSRFRIDQVRALRDELAGESVATRATRPALGTGRADVIVAGVSILLAALEHCGANTLVVRDRGLRYALL